MPVIAIGAAVFAVSAAVATGFAVFATVAAVGAVIGAIGAVTNNKALMIAGGIVGAIGGIGALAQSAGIIGSDAALFGGSFSDGFGSGGSLFGGSSSAEADVASWSGYGADLDMQGNPMLQSPIDMQGNPALSGTPTSTSAEQIVDQTTGALQSIDASTSPSLSSASSPDVTPAGTIDNKGVALPQGDAEGGTLGTVNNPAADPNATTNSILNGGTGVPSSSAPATPSAPDVQGNPALADVTGAPATGGTVTGAPQANIPAGMDAQGNPLSGNSAWSGIKDFLKENNRLVAGVVQAGSSFIAGATNGLTPAQIAALNAQAEANQAAANLSRLQQSNMSQPLPYASRRVETPPVTGAPAGIINTAPPRASMGAA